MKRHIERLAIANRGEVAVRIINACKELGIETVLLHSEADVNTMAYRLSDRQVCVGPAPVPESYFSIENNVNAALSAGADAIHPGFGFLSENADFAQACGERRITFVGPSPEAIRVFGDKVSAKKVAEAAGAPVIPGYEGSDQSVEILLREMDRIGFPVIVKAAGGGGGRGLRVVESRDKAQEAIESAQREGQNAFGNSRIFLEKYLGHAKHIEVQIFGDSDGQVFHLYERECSVQRRHQKIVEEALSPSLSPEVREAMTTSAVKIGQEGGYTGAGTVEFLYQDDQFYFLEMNTRLQVEHPVTEMVLGVDLVKAQLLSVQGLGPFWRQEDLRPRGHAIECRLYAENSFQNGMPSTGLLGGCSFPAAPGRRFELGFEPGDEITPYYDSMIAKVVVWDETRPRAIEKMLATLRETVVFGVHTNLPYLQEILSHPEFVSGEMTTQFIATHFPQGLSAEDYGQPLDRSVFQAAKEKIRVPSSNQVSECLLDPWNQSWKREGVGL